MVTIFAFDNSSSHVKLANDILNVMNINLNSKDFLNQKPILQVIEEFGHKIIFYFKFHCKLNYIEIYWKAAKYYRQNFFEVYFTLNTTCKYFFTGFRLKK
ncbi:hypothetical protein RIR_jg33705.t1 [Rhizophagus irregularis DAOM 181602=DAOM 197198]|nr:hypothetical protein RIR_jg33705.t1 [Rhizophagus irregularis DAOM 181602=DAOM 197198]